MNKTTLMSKQLVTATVRRPLWQPYRRYAFIKLELMHENLRLSKVIRDVPLQALQIEGDLRGSEGGSRRLTLTCKTS